VPVFRESVNGTVEGWSDATELPLGCVARVALGERNAASSPLPVGRVAVSEQNATSSSSNATGVARAEQNSVLPASRVGRVALSEQNDRSPATRSPYCSARATRPA